MAATSVDDIDTSVPVYTSSINSTTKASDISQLSHWLEKYVNVDAMGADAASIPELIVLAQQRMYRRARTHESEMGGDLFKLVKAKPDTPYWGHAGASADFVIQAMQAYGINAHRVNLWHTISDAHVAMEYQSLTFGKLVFYDPLYGVAMLNREGIPASLNDLLGEFAGRGLNFSEWEFQPVQIGSPDGNAFPGAADLRFAKFLTRDYRQILRSYFHVVSVGTEDYTPQQGLLPGEAVARGRWTVYNQIPLLADMSREDEFRFLDDFNTQYNVEHQGRYYLTGQRTIEATPVTLDHSFRTNHSAFGLFWTQVKTGSTTPTQRSIWEKWLSHYTELKGNPVTIQNAAERLIAAQRSMLLQATIHEMDVNGELLQLALNNPETAYWANCSSSSDFLLAGLRAFGVPAHRVTLWHTPTDSHEAIEYYNPAFGKYTFYDPVYGIKMVDAAGVPAGFNDLQEQIQKYGFDSSAWRFQPQKIAPPKGISPTAVDARYEYFDQRDYHEILNFYFNFTAVRYLDYTPQQGLLAGSTVARGKWMFYDASRYSQEFSEQERQATRDELFAEYSVENDGRYYLTGCEAGLFGDESDHKE